MDDSARLTLISRLVAVLMVGALVTFLFPGSLVIAIVIFALTLILVVLWFYFFLTRKEKGPLPGAEESMRISMRANALTYMVTLCIMVVLALMEFIGITRMTAFYALGLVIVLSVIAHSVIQEYLNAKEKVK
jgi:hypothetical protein